MTSVVPFPNLSSSRTSIQGTSFSSRQLRQSTGTNNNPILYAPDTDPLIPELGRHFRMPPFRFDLEKPHCELNPLDYRDPMQVSESAGFQGPDNGSVDGLHPKRFIRQAEMFDMEAFEHWVQGVKRKSNQAFHEHENYQMDADNDLLPVPHNTAVTNGMRFDIDGCLLATRQRHNPNPDASMNPRDAAPNDVPYVPPSSDFDFAMELSYPSPSSSERKIAPLPRRHLNRPSQTSVSHTSNVQSTKFESTREPVLPVHLPNKRQKIVPSKRDLTESRVDSGISTTPDARLFGPRTRANPDSERIGNFPKSSLSFSLISKPKVAKLSPSYIRASTVSSDTSEGTSSSDSDSGSTNPNSKSNSSHSGMFQCYSKSCPLFFSSLDEIKDHFRSSHLPSTVQLRCAYTDCSKMTNSLGDMGRHEQALAHMAPSFQCHSPSCGKVFTRKDALRRHWSRVSGHEAQSRRAEKARAMMSS
ncbi:hypothetical protein K435DRAFT_793648 [Dendrothele bispora CBS 962.96]|uniref:C2H2-type domain-containing protein n=1 Tax=Dendrothele bispora (strain CBS 962.96) TaxID=1314807 RepID=A0A4S8MEP5_DENBC|nr:hypothetical protein K435DRAFT_793648 [Dendrothele bispora CBS 962.96]